MYSYLYTGQTCLLSLSLLLLRAICSLIHSLARSVVLSNVSNRFYRISWRGVCVHGTCNRAVFMVSCSEYWILHRRSNRKHWLSHGSVMWQSARTQTRAHIRDRYGQRRFRAVFVLYMQQKSILYSNQNGGATTTVVLSIYWVQRVCSFSHIDSHSGLNFMFY